MKLKLVLRNRFVRLAAVAVCVWTGLVAAAFINPIGADAQTETTPVQADIQPSDQQPAPTAGAYNNQTEPPTGKAGTCPPLIINASIASGSAQYPGVNGNQNGRLNRDANTSRCGLSKTAPSVLDTGTNFQFNAYTFTNTSASPACVSVSSSNKSAAAVFMVAYLGSFNPNNVAQNYLADAGGAGEGRSFSFTVPANSDFVLVFSRVTTGAVTITYSFNVIGLPGCNTCPPSRIDGDMTNGSADYVAMQSDSNGRLNRDANTSRCGLNKTVPAVLETGTAFQFDAYTFVNSSGSDACISVAVSNTSSAAIFAQAYLDNFNQNNISQNYLADAGGAGEGRSLAFTVPAQRAFVVVFTRVNTQAATITYSFNVIGLPGCTICPPARVAGNTSTGSTQYLAHSSIQNGILGRDGSVSACGTTKSTPNVLNSGTDFDFNAFNFVNTTNFSQCITVATVSDSLTTVPISTVAYLDNFNQNNIQQNYLGDSGAVGLARSFSFTVPPKRSFVLVFHRTTNGGTTPATYRFSVTGLSGCTTCPPQTITATLGIGTVQTVLDFTGIQEGIPNRPGLTVTDNCSAGETFPGLFDAATNVKFDAYMFTNPSDVADCFDIVLRNNTATTGIFASVYLDSFNRQSLATNYFADGGAAAALRSFSVTIPAKRTFIVVVSQINTATTTVGYDLSIKGLSGCSECTGVSLTPSTLANGTTGTAYNQTVSGAGGTAPFGFVLSNNGPLPNGLSLNASTGAITGTPTVNGSFTFQVQAVDDNLCLGKRNYTINIQPNTGCTFTVSPTSTLVPGVGGFRQFQVTAPAGCPWTAVNNTTSMMALTSNSSGAGNGTVTISIFTNSGAARSGTLTIAGQTVTVNQQRGTNADTPGQYRPTNGFVYLRNSNDTGFANAEFFFGLASDIPVAGDWDGDGDDTIGIFRAGQFFLRNSNDTGFADINFAFGTTGDIPIAGDWDGDGVDTIGLVRGNLIFLRNSNTGGAPDATLVYGSASDIYIAGDWDGDGIDTIGAFRPTNGFVYLRNTNTTGVADIEFFYGIAGDKPVAGDWNNDGIDTIGIVRGNDWFLRNSNTTGFAEIVFTYGTPTDIPIVGDWNGAP
jgi:hypothetical protein